MLKLVIMNKRLVEELLKARNAVKRKFHSIKIDSAQSELELDKKLKPIAQPLKELISNIKSENVHFKVEPRQIKDSLDRNPDVSYTAARKNLEENYQTVDESSREPSFLESDVIAESDPVPTLEDLQHELSLAGTSPAFEEYLDQYDGLARNYIEDMFRNTKNDFDHHYGIRYTPENNKFEIGNAEINFVGEDIVIKLPSNEEFEYEGTPGLYELLFKKTPLGIREQDRKNYKDILERTNAARRNYKPNEQIQGTASKKYSNTVKQLLFPKPAKPTRSARPTHTKKGSGMQMLNFNNKRLEFVPWKDPNKLVNWLRILMSSKSAGHTGHTNEIIYIIDELRKAKIIK